MLPVLFSIGSFSVSSFGVFLALAFLLAVFACWRLARVYDVDEEKILDLALMVFFGSIVGARLLFLVFHPNLFFDLERAFLLNRYPGLSFWGGFLGGSLALWFFGRKSKLEFWQTADFAAIGLLVGLILGNAGCFLGGCSYGVPSNSFLAVPVTGLIGKRLPLPLIESALFLLIFAGLWKRAVRFHFQGKIAALALTWIGLVKFFAEFYRGDSQRIFPSAGLTYGHLFALLIFVAGIAVFYYRGKRSFLADLKEVWLVFSTSKKRQAVILQLKRSWRNQLVNFRVRYNEVMKFFRSLPKNLKKRLNVKSTPTNFDL